MFILRAVGTAHAFKWVARRVLGVCCIIVRLVRIFRSADDHMADSFTLQNFGPEIQRDIDSVDDYCFACRAAQERAARGSTLR